MIDKVAIKSAIDNIVQGNRSRNGDYDFLNYVYHFSDIKNVVSILRKGQLMSRREAIHESVMINDNAAQNVIAGTDDQVTDLVRFYFRPKTPTQYYNEGIKTPEEIEEQPFRAHCPIPVFLCFKAEEILSREDCYFSDHTLAAHQVGALMQTVDEYRNLPFDDILHNRSLYNIDEETKRLIVARRHAEVVVSNHCSLASLAKIIVRSVPEKELLLSLLTESEIDYFSDMIGVDNKKAFFFANRAYVAKATLDDESISLKFNPGKKNEEFDVKVKIVDLDSSKSYGWHSRIALTDMPNLGLPTLVYYMVEFFINDTLAYKSIYNRNVDGIPF